MKFLRRHKRPKVDTKASHNDPLVEKHEGAKLQRHTHLSHAKHIEKSRNRRKFQVVKKYFVGFGIVNVVIILGAVGWYQFVFLNRPLYISPLPFNFSSEAATSDPKEQARRTVEAELRKKQIVYSHIDMVPPTTYSISLNGKGEILMTDTKNIAQQVASLQVVLNQLKIEGRSFKRLDLRFEKPVITF